MYFCQPAKRIVLNFTSVLGKRKNPQAPANLRCEINCKKKREVKQRRRSLRLHFLASELKKINFWSVVSVVCQDSDWLWKQYSKCWQL